jgi:trigger factor
MQVTEDHPSATKIKLTIRVDDDSLLKAKDLTIRRLGKDVRISGFRSGKAPLPIIQKNLDQTTLQNEFLDAVLNKAYVDAITERRIRPLERPEIKITKFVPFTEVEFSAEFEAIGKIELPDYTHSAVQRKPVSVSNEDINEVLNQLVRREAARKEITQAANDGDQTVIDFSGVDTKSKDPIPGADGKNYPLILGSNSFIPGFEKHLVGMKAGDKKSFDIIFPKDYSVKSLQSRKVTFSVSVIKVYALSMPELSDSFAAKVGPFKTLDELKADIRKQLLNERNFQADRDLENAILESIVEKAKVVIPDKLINEQIEKVEEDERRKLAQQGQTWQEHLHSEGVTEAEHKKKLAKLAEQQIKTSFVLSEIAERENLTVNADELKVRLTLLRNQYPDKQMQTELENPDNQQEIANRLLVEKTLAKLRSLVV